MSKVAQTLKPKLAILAAIVIIVAVGLGVYVQTKNSGDVQTLTNSQHQITQISYKGTNNVNAYVLLKKYAVVQAKHYSFGYFVTSINGVAGNGPKYWTMYVNGKESNVGASDYITKDSDTITWKLQ
jgi:hypothetical protein